MLTVTDKLIVTLKSWINIVWHGPFQGQIYDPSLRTMDFSSPVPYTRGEGLTWQKRRVHLFMRSSSLHIPSVFNWLFQKKSSLYFADESSTRRISDASPVATLALNTHCFWDSGNVPFFVPKVGWETKFNSIVKLDWMQHFPLFSLVFLPIHVLFSLCLIFLVQTCY